MSPENSVDVLFALIDVPNGFYEENTADAAAGLRHIFVPDLRALRVLRGDNFLYLDARTAVPQSSSRLTTHQKCPDRIANRYTHRYGEKKNEYRSCGAQIGR